MNRVKYMSDHWDMIGSIIANFSPFQSVPHWHVPGPLRRPAWSECPQRFANSSGKSTTRFHSRTAKCSSPLHTLALPEIPPVINGYFSKTIKIRKRYCSIWTTLIGRKLDTNSSPTFYLNFESTAPIVRKLWQLKGHLSNKNQLFI